MKSISPTERLLGALTVADCNPTPSGSGWSAQCPTHDDRRPSLSISEGDDGKALLDCKAGCLPQSVVAAVGLTMRDLFPDDRYSETLSARHHRDRGKQKSRQRKNGEPKGRGYSTDQAAVAALDDMMEPKEGRRVGQWPYHDAQGEHVATMVRYDLPTDPDQKQEKTFRPVARRGTKWFIIGMPDPNPLYALPDLADAELVYITEGEQAADAARSIGLVATTSAQGAKSPEKTDWSPLAGKVCVILPDCDEPGAKYADAVTAILAKLSPPAVVKVVKLPDLPDKGDIADFLDLRQSQGKTGEEILAEVKALVDEAKPVRSVPSVELVLPKIVVVTDQKDSWPDSLAEDAYYGLTGEIVRTIEPHSEADPVAIIVQVLVAFGNLIGRCAHFRAEADMHFGNLFTTLVGVTSKGRKGASWGQVKRLVALVAPEWCEQNIVGGLASGEGLIWNVRDPISRHEPIRDGGRKTGKVIGYQDVVADPGVIDKRILVQESEFASVLQVCSREKNTLSAIIRQAWDTGCLRTMAKNSPARATDAHISIVGHITRDELRRLITSTDMANGLANRFLWICVQRSKALPEGGNLGKDELQPLAQRLERAFQFARTVGEMCRDDSARTIWRDVYEGLSSGTPGLLGAVTSRAESQVMRLAMLYALLDEARVIRAEHLSAALALWKYAEQSSQFIFGSATGDPVADEILRALRQRKPAGMTRTDIRDLLGKHKTADRIDESLNLLSESQLARHEKIGNTGGRPVEMWFAIG